MRKPYELSQEQTEESLRRAAQDPEYMKLYWAAVRLAEAMERGEVKDG